MAPNSLLRYDFLKNKYGKELLIDLGRVEALEGYVLNEDLHLITFYEVLIITEGAGYFGLDGEETTIEPGTVVVTLPNQIRQWKIDRTVKGFTFFFEGEFLNTYFRDEIFLNRFRIFDYSRPVPGIRLTSEGLEKCLWAMHEVEREFGRLQGDSTHLLRSLLYYSISLIDRQYREHNGQNPQDGSSVVYRFKKLLNQNIRRWHTAVAYAEALHISHNHLNKLCKESLRLTALEIIHQRLLLEAKREIRFSNRTISEVAYRLGFSDVSNFNRFFKRNTGTTPRNYRAQLTSQSED